MCHRNNGRTAFTLLELLVVIALVAVLLSLLMSAVQRVRAAAARVDCQNRVKQLALALHAYHDARNGLPPGHNSAGSPARMPYSGWTLSSLAYIEQVALATGAEADYHANPNPFAPPHPGLRAVVRAFACPADSRPLTAQTSARTNSVIALTSYLGVAGFDAAITRDGMLFQDSRIRLADALDGTSNTLLLGERPPSHDNQFGWWYAGVGQQLTGSADLVLGVREPNLLPITTSAACGPGRYSFGPANFNDPCGMFHFWSSHPGGANFALADGSVRFITYQGAPLMPSLASRAGGEVVSIPND
jgi:prepilin-type N-terminal cleavage/methylation domain-containing protein/prepilin-type processing-associated H-X9-DG protein